MFVGVLQNAAVGHVGRGCLDLNSRDTSRLHLPPCFPGSSRNRLVGLQQAVAGRRPPGEARRRRQGRGHPPVQRRATPARAPRAPAGGAALAAPATSVAEAAAAAAAAVGGGSGTSRSSSPAAAAATSAAESPPAGASVTARARARGRCFGGVSGGMNLCSVCGCCLHRRPISSILTTG